MSKTSSTTTKDKPGLFPALLKYWRGRRGLSQLDLALNADVSARHVSFMETGRAQPSEGMVLRLGSALDVPLREQNAMLRAAGFGSLYPEPAQEGLTRAVSMAIDRMMAQQEPYPLVVMDRRYKTFRQNGAADRLLSRFIADPSQMTFPVNALRVVFDPAGARPFIVDWERTARLILTRMHREVLNHPEDEALSKLLDELLSYPDVPPELRYPDLAQPSIPAFTVRLERDDLKLAFLTTVTQFNAPQNVTLDELMIESYFPLDEATERACRDMASA